MRARPSGSPDRGEKTVQRQWTRTKRWTAFGVLVALMFGVADRALAEPDQARGLPGLSPSRWTGAIGRDTMSDARQGYILGITDGLRLATVFDRARVDENPVMDCVRRLSGERLSQVIAGYLDGVSIGAHEPTLHFLVWDALLATSRDCAAPPLPRPTIQPATSRGRE